MSVQAENAVIMAAGASSRFAPLSYERPKALLTVRGEVLIERQIRQLQQAGISDIALVIGYQKEKFYDLKEKFGVKLLENPDYHTKNNPSSLWAARELLGNTYVCSSDNYFVENPFTKEVDGSYYSAVYVSGETDEWCLIEDETGRICGVTVGGKDAWVMLGHTFWSAEFSRRFLKLLEAEYAQPEVCGRLWEYFLMAHLDQLPMQAKHYPPGVIYEFDDLEELRVFDPAYRENSHSPILEELSNRLNCHERELGNFAPAYGEGNEAVGCTFSARGNMYRYLYAEREMERLK